MEGIIGVIVVVVFSIIAVKGMGRLASRSSLPHPTKRRHNRFRR